MPSPIENVTKVWHGYGTGFGGHGTGLGGGLVFFCACHAYSRLRYVWRCGKIIFWPSSVWRLVLRMAFGALEDVLLH